MWKAWIYTECRSMTGPTWTWWTGGLFCLDQITEHESNKLWSLAKLTPYRLNYMGYFWCGSISISPVYAKWHYSHTNTAAATCQLPHRCLVCNLTLNLGITLSLPKSPFCITLYNINPTFHRRAIEKHVLPCIWHHVSRRDMTTTVHHVMVHWHVITFHQYSHRLDLVIYKALSENVKAAFRQKWCQVVREEAYQLID